VWLAIRGTPVFLPQLPATLKSRCGLWRLEDCPPVTTTPARRTSPSETRPAPGRVIVALAAVLAVIAVGIITLSAGPASASPLVRAQNGVAVIAHGAGQRVGPNERILAGESRIRAPDYDRSVVGSGVGVPEAESGSGLTFAVDSAGDTTVSLRTAAGDTYDFSPHSLQRLAERGVNLDQASNLLNDSSRSFQYFHDGAWKTGFYDPTSKLFIGTANGNVTTVIGNASQNYINNLMAAQP
jgi:hypothetical protein